MDKVFIIELSLVNFAVAWGSAMPYHAALSFQLGGFRWKQESPFYV
ncbi:hypothetical protein HCH_05062 [Hahella chejuensis KCTC 2396]|uniref:Uncharacterized protein n=1 Tax=Hahella chejuensis (strain KCTC 2396) TaxID=349521 RepID=Q2SC79_HAHCH|nr:hypothetical protein HCH_05062 [Hahella chejuensis KCTC 2396]